MSEAIAEATAETLKFFASSSRFKDLLDAIVDDNVATVEQGDDLDALKRELELEMTATIPRSDILGQQEVDNCYNSILLTFEPLADDQKTASEVLGNKARVRFWMVRQGPNSTDTPDEVTLTFIGNTCPTGVQSCFRVFIRARKSRSNIDVAALRVMTKAGATMFNADLRRFIPSSAILWAQVEGSTWAVPCNARSEMDRLRPPATPNATPIRQDGPRSRTSKGGGREEGASAAHEVIDPSEEEAEHDLHGLNPQIQQLVDRQVRIALAKPSTSLIDRRGKQPDCEQSKAYLPKTSSPTNLVMDHLSTDSKVLRVVSSLLLPCACFTCPSIGQPTQRNTLFAAIGRLVDQARPWGSTCSRRRARSATWGISSQHVRTGPSVKRGCEAPTCAPISMLCA
jgi:hypothetical protein